MSIVRPCLVAAMAAIAASSAAAPAAAQNSPPDSLDVVLSQLGISGETVVGDAPAIELSFPPPKHKLAGKGNFVRLFLSHSPDVDPTQSTVFTSVNGTQVNSSALGPTTGPGTVIQIPVAAPVLHTQTTNKVGVKFNLVPATTQPAGLALYGRVEDRTMIHYQLAAANAPALVIAHKAPTEAASPVFASRAVVLGGIIGGVMVLLAALLLLLLVVRGRRRSRRQAIAAPAPWPWPIATAREQVDRELTRALQYNRPLSLGLVGVPISDTNGSTNDERMDVLAEFMRRDLTKFDTVVRYGPAELLLILPELSAEAARAGAGALAELASKQLNHDVTDAFVTFPEDGTTADRLLMALVRNYERRRATFLASHALR